MSILRREVFYDNTGGVARFWDWASTLTTLGTMAEPFNPGWSKTPDTSLIDFDPTDEIARIDSITAKPRDISLLYLSGGDRSLNGGDLHPRLGP